ncbi:MAG: hypothetical protein IME93_06235, partial [Proteobacteria bacterium]|nr:hypothetical protein [Pseudomonadota bacterium]
EANGRYSNLVELKNELLKTHAYIDGIVLRDAGGKSHEQLVSVFHAIDHVQRLHDRCFEDARRANIAAQLTELQTDRNELISTVILIINDMEQGRYLDAAERGMALAADVDSHVDGLRNQIMIRVAQNKISADDGTRQLEAIRWHNRVSDHVSRLTHYLAAVAGEEKR